MSGVEGCFAEVFEGPSLFGRHERAPLACSPKHMKRLLKETPEMSEIHGSETPYSNRDDPLAGARNPSAASDALSNLKRQCTSYNAWKHP